MTASSLSVLSAGGWSTADPKSTDVKAAAKFAVQKTYPDVAADFKVVSAKKQVVAGMNYDLIVDVTTPDENCAVNHFIVWDRFGPDHMAILLPLIFNKRWYHSCIYGVVWGCGHGVTSVVIGLVSFAMKSYVVDLSDLFTRYRFVMDGVVGLTLVVIGLMGIAESKNDADGAEDEGKNVKETTDQHDIENINTPQDIAINLSNGSSIATNINSNTRPLFAYLALFVNGAVLGVSWDGLPSLAPSVVLDNTHSLSLFLAAYLLGTVLAMGTASGAVGQATYYISHRMSNNNTASTADSATEASNDTSKSTHISSHLAYMSSLVSCLIGAAWVLLAVLKYVISVTSGDSVIVGSDTVYSNINVNNIIGNDGTGHMHHFEEVQSLQHSRDHVFHRVAHSHDEMSGDRLSSHLDMLFSACSVLLILAVMFVTIGREYHLLGCGNTANSSTGTNSIQTRITSVGAGESRRIKLTPFN
eukprot:gene21967-28050_t